MMYGEPTSPRLALALAQAQQRPQRPQQQAFGPPPTQQMQAPSTPQAQAPQQPHAQAPQQAGVQPQTRRPPLLAQEQIERDGVYRTICDYIAGMTDRYAVREYSRLFDPDVRV